MRSSRPLALLAIGLTMACTDVRQPTEPSAPAGPAQTISDGAHGGNKDFFFLPPLVSDPSKDPNFEPGQFNPNLAPALTVEICELRTSPVDALGQPVVTECIDGPPRTKFPAGTVQLQNPPDGFYQVIWHVAESNLDATKFYRIKVLVQGSTIPFGVADVDPVASMKELRNARTGETIPLNENSTLPIKFRIEHGGGAALCGTASLCVSTTVSATTTDPSGVQNVTVDGGAGSIAGASFPNGWLPAGGPQNVVVTVAQVPVVGGGTVTDAAPCHDGLALPQFKGCFQFTTTPALQPINKSGDEFAVPVRVAVCYELDGTGSPLEKFAELWSSGPNEPAHPLSDATDAGLLGAASRNCSTGPVVIGQASTNAIVQLAAAGWQHLRSGLSRMFGVRTAYAVDLGLGGFTTSFSRVSPVLTAEIIPYTSINLTNLAPGATTTATARIVGNNHHATQTLATGLGGLPVTFTLASGNGSLLPLGGTGAGSNQVTITTNTNPIDGSAVSGGGFAPVNWTMPTPTDPGTYTYTLTANGPALGGPVTFTSTVTVAPPTVQAGSWNQRASMPAPLYGHGVASVGGILYVLGGTTLLPSGAQGPSTAIRAYDPALNSWSLAGNLAQSRTYQATVVSGGVIYSIGGFTGAGSLSSVETFNPATGAQGSLPDMPSPRDGAGAAIVNGVLYVLGGNTDPCCSSVSTVYAYDFAAGTWSTKTPMPKPRHIFATQVVNGSIYLIGGRDFRSDTGNSGTLSEVYAYNPATDTWSGPLAPMPHPAMMAISGVVGGLIYVAGGITDGIASPYVDAYDPVNNVWISKASLPDPRGDAAGGLNNGLLYVLGGFENSILSTRNDAFSP